ncbi:DapH/DapD/GlmU-related protein [Curtobacterium sp. ISL-83]|uniref:acyltransferase n=1 Tax=Curtobacterium sp. ISL-83 TaxID=2819145 RepID=UPI001BEACA37|nr:acyltransferase [Curtobacterium sp. ISL-83]MBT2502718.1 acyltransferase [Curtobacterium sp. ISL-83]
MSLLLPLLASVPVPVRFRWRVLRMAGLDTAVAGIERSVSFWNRKVTIGPGSYVNRGVKFEGAGKIELGSHVAIGPDALILTSTHEIGPSEWRAGSGTPRVEPVTIGDGTWIGARATILPGVTIGRGCVIAANALVREDCPDNTFWAGVPARMKKSLP